MLVPSRPFTSPSVLTEAEAWWNHGGHSEWSKARASAVLNYFVENHCALEDSTSEAESAHLQMNSELLEHEVTLCCAVSSERVAKPPEETRLTSDIWKQGRRQRATGIEPGLSPLCRRRAGRRARRRLAQACHLACSFLRGTGRRGSAHERARRQAAGAADLLPRAHLSLRQRHRSQRDGPGPLLRARPTAGQAERATSLWRSALPGFC